MMQPIATYTLFLIIGDVASPRNGAWHSRTYCGYPYSAILHVIHVLPFGRGIHSLFRILFLTVGSRVGELRSIVLT